jgi:uncharacterized protein (TIGR03435 family)
MILRAAHRWVFWGTLLMVGMNTLKDPASFDGLVASKFNASPTAPQGTSTPADSLALDKVSIAETKEKRDMRKIEPTRFRGTGTLLNVVSWAYETPPNSIEYWNVNQIVLTRYDITLTTSHAVSEGELRQKVQALLADRFQLRVKPGTRKQTFYRLVVGRNGPKFQTFPLALVKMDKLFPRIKHEFRRTSMPEFAKFLSGSLEYPVVDETGLSGVYDFDLVLKKVPVLSTWDWEPEEFSALKTLGLKLKTSERSADQLVIERLKRPRDN